jgi:hypothetical protein
MKFPIICNEGTLSTGSNIQVFPTLADLFHRMEAQDILDESFYFFDSDGQFLKPEGRWFWGIEINETGKFDKALLMFLVRTFREQITGEQKRMFDAAVSKIV